MAGQIIIVSGTSGSGKSTTCQLFVQRADEFWLLYGIDQFMATTFPSKFGHHGPRCGEGVAACPVDETDTEGPLRWRFGELGSRAFSVLHEWIASASHEGCNIIIDHLMMTDPPVLQDCVQRLKGLPVLYVILKPPYEVLMERVASRQMGSKMQTPQIADGDREKIIRDRLQRLRPWFYQSVYANQICDLQIDTVAQSPEAVCQLIEKRLAEGPGTAFEQLQHTYS
jgi:chloramphenicol 3-O-phosphotransferase